MKATLGPATGGDYSTMMREAIRSRRSRREGAASYTPQTNPQAYTNSMADSYGVARGTIGGAVGSAPDPIKAPAPITMATPRPKRIGSYSRGIY